jgi:hypothetical protein
MQASAILKKPLTTEWAIVHYRSHVRKDQRTPQLFQRNWAAKVTLASTQYYRKSSLIRDTRSAFTPADTAERSKGFLVTNGTLFWVTPAVDFIAPWGELEPIWEEREAEAERKRIQREQEAAIAAKEQEKRRQRQSEAMAFGNQRATARRTGTLDSIEALLGKDALARSYVVTHHDISWNEDYSKMRVKIDGTVQLSLQDFERLVEKYNEALDEAR